MGRPRWWCHALAATFSAIFIATPLVMILDRRDPINVEAMSLIPNETKAGNPVTMRWRATVNRPGCNGIVIRRFISTTDHIIREAVGQPTVFRGIIGNKTQEFETQFNIPNNLAPGSYTYEPIVTRWCNFMQKHFWPIYTYQPPVNFTVVQ